MSTELLTFDIRYIDLANDRLEGLSMEDLALKYDMPLFQIAEVLELPEVVRYVDKIVAGIGYNNRVKRAKLIEHIIEKKITEMEESEMWSRKDIVELLKLAQDEDKLTSPAAPTIQVNSQTNNYKTFMADLFDKPLEADT